MASASADARGSSVRHSPTMTSSSTPLPAASAETATGFVRMTHVLKNASKDLRRGQMVHLPNLTFMDAMGAVQVLDPRMDGGMDPIPAQQTAACDTLPDGERSKTPFLLHAPLSFDDVLWIIDRTMACEAAWLESGSLSGASLSQTIHTCLYIHHLTLLHPSMPDLPEQPAPPAIALHVLRPYLMGLLKCVGLMWDELTKGNLMDGEDFNGDKAGISLLEDVHPENVLHSLHDAIEWTTMQKTQHEAAHAIRARLQFRKHYLTAIFLISCSDPAAPFSGSIDVLATLNNVREELRQATADLHEIFVAPPHVASPFMDRAPSDVARAAFDPWFTRRSKSTYSTYTPMSLAPPQSLLLPAPSKWRSVFLGIIDGMVDFDLVAGSYHGWKDWKCFFDREAIHFQQCQDAPYVRSLRQSALCLDSTIALRKPLKYIAQSFLLDVASLRPNLVQEELQNASAASVKNGQETHMLQKRYGYFEERLAGQLVAHLRNLAQNRSHSRRKLARSYGDLLSLCDEGSALGWDLCNSISVQHIHVDQLSDAVNSLALDTMLHCIFAGIELNLYRDDELCMEYWMAHQAASKLYSVYAKLSEWNKRQSRNNVYVDVQVAWSSLVCSASKAFFFVYERQVLNRNEQLAWLSTSHFSQQIDSLTEETDQMMFFKRFKWLDVKQRPESHAHVDGLWQAFHRESHNVEQMTKAERLTEARSLLERACDDCATLMKLSSSKQYHCRALSFPIMLDAFRRLCNAMSNAINGGGTDNDKDSRSTLIEQRSPHNTHRSPQYCLLPLVFEAESSGHPWFPTLAQGQE